MGQSYDYDVIVIGGGPAGSTVARYAAKAGISVLVLDARNSIGSPLQCGELVPTNDEMRRLCPDVPEMDDLFQNYKLEDDAKKIISLTPTNYKINTIKKI